MAPKVVQFVRQTKHSKGFDAVRKAKSLIQFVRQSSAQFIRHDISKGLGVRQRT